LNTCSTPAASSVADLGGVDNKAARSTVPPQSGREIVTAATIALVVAAAADGGSTLTGHPPRKLRRASAATATGFVAQAAQCPGLFGHHGHACRSADMLCSRMPQQRGN
jgi:hypothetical protein